MEVVDRSEPSSAEQVTSSESSLSSPSLASVWAFGVGDRLPVRWSDPRDAGRAVARFPRDRGLDVDPRVENRDIGPGTTLPVRAERIRVPGVDFRNEGRNPAAGTYTVEATLTATDDRPAATATVEV